MAKGQISDDEEDEEEEQDEEFEDGEDVRDVDAGPDVDGASDEDEDEEEGQDEYEKDGFIVDEDEDEEGEEEEETRESSDEEAKARKKKRKKRNEDNDELDEDDYALLRESNVPFHRPKSKTKFKRLKKARKLGGDDDQVSRRGLSDEEDEEEDGNRRGRSAEEELGRRLFGDDDVQPDDLGEEEEAEEEEDIGEEDDEMADFIVDEEEGEDDGHPFRRKKVKKKKPQRQAAGVSSVALQEAQDIFGDVSALLDERRQRELEVHKEELLLIDDGDGSGRRNANKLLEKQFEPSILEEKFMTSKDDLIRDCDVPERIQLLEAVAGPFPTSESAREEAAWIFERVFGKDASLQGPEFLRLATKEKDDIVKQIGDVLHLMHEEKLEVPFIAMYRKEKCLDFVQEEVEGDSNDSGRPKLKHFEALWALHYWDKKWLLLRRRKAGLERAYEKRRLSEARKGNEKTDLCQQLLQALVDANTDQAVDDVDAKFNLHFPPDEVDLEPGQFKRPKQRSFYSLCRKAGLGAVANHFGLTPEHFGENMSAMYKRHEVEDDTETPEDVANGHLVGEFHDAISVLRGARHMAAVEISTEPAVRDYVRLVYKKAVVSTRPTPEGNTVIDSFHQYSGVKWLKDKPLEKFVDGQWLLIQKAEEEKLLEVTVGLSSVDINENLMPEFENVYLSEGVSRTAQLWNEQRKEILKDCLRNMLLPAIEKEARMALRSTSKQWVAAACSRELWNKVCIAPYTDPKPDAFQDYDGLAPRVMACCWGPGKPATTFVMLDSAGEIVNILYTGYLTIRGNTPEQAQRKLQDQSRLLEFMIENQPHVVVVGGANLACRRLYREIYEVVFKIFEEHPREMKGLDTIQVEYGDETIPQLYENSRISEEQLVGHPGIVRRAVALGRYLQNPLAMVATLCGPGKELLSLKLHSLQNFLSTEEMYEGVERVMITVANQVGVDINLAASHDWLFSPLQFISGLGPRKASSFQRSIQGAGRVGSRKEMLLNLRLMDRKVFISSAGFLRVRGTGQAPNANQIMDPLDDTRIHPESYELAKRMAEDALCEEEQTKIEDMDEDALELAIEHVRRNPQYLANMVIDVYGSHLAKGGPVTNYQTLEMIQIELQYGYQEWRTPYKKISPEEEFNMLSGESEETLAEGSIVHATVKEIQENRVMCNLESGLLGIIRNEDISDDSNVNPAESVPPGTVVTCRVKRVVKSKYLVDLICKGSALRGERWMSQRPQDPYYKPDMGSLRDEQEKAKKKNDEEKRNAFKPRMIVHPQFQNVSLTDAMQSLADKDVGEVLIRPSSKGPTHLSMTLKFFDGVYVHIDIVEGGKDKRDVTSFLRLGKTLTIGDETFEDIDEVIARYVDPLVSNLKEVLRYRKFKRGQKKEVDDALKEEKRATPTRIPYFFSICHEHPGAFRLSYIKGVMTVTHEYISVSSKGLKFRKRLFDRTDKLVSYFQKHFSDPLPDVAPRRALAAMVPPRSPAPSLAGSYQNGQWGPGRSVEGPASGWDSADGWDQSGGRGSNNGSWGRGIGPSGGRSAWDQQGRGGSNSGGPWAPVSGGGSELNGWSGSAPGGLGGNRVAPGLHAGRPNWDRSQQSQRGGFKSGPNGWGHPTGFPDVPSIPPVSDSTWGSRKTVTADNSGWDSAGPIRDPPSTRTPARSGWNSEVETHGTGRSSWEDPTGNRSGWGKQIQEKTSTSSWEQPRGDPRRAGAGREASKQSDGAWEQSSDKDVTGSGWETSDVISQGGGRSALGEAPVDSKARKVLVGTQDILTAKEGASSGWDQSEPTSGSGGSSKLWDDLGNSNARSGAGGTAEDRAVQGMAKSGWKTPQPSLQSAGGSSALWPTPVKGVGGTWEKLAEPSSEIENSGWTSTSPESQLGAWQNEASKKASLPEGSSWDQSNSSSLARSEWGGQVSNWDSSEGRRKPHGGDTDEVSKSQESSRWDHPAARVDGQSSWESSKDKSLYQGADRPTADPRRVNSGWDQQTRGRAGGWDRGPVKGTLGPAAQSGVSQYAAPQSGWNADWEKTSSDKGDEVSEQPPSKRSPESSWSTEPEAPKGGRSGWDSTEQFGKSAPDTSREPAAPGTSDSTAAVGSQDDYTW